MFVDLGAAFGDFVDFGESRTCLDGWAAIKVEVRLGEGCTVEDEGEKEDGTGLAR